MAHLNRLTATQAAHKLAAREITSEALVEDCLERIAERDSQVRAWTLVDADGARGVRASSIAAPRPALCTDYRSR